MLLCLFFFFAFSVPAAAEGEGEEWEEETREALREALPDLAADPADSGEVAALLAPDAVAQTILSGFSTAFSRVGSVAAVSGALLLLAFAASLLFPGGGDLCDRAVALGGTLMLSAAMEEVFGGALSFFSDLSALGGALSSVFAGIFAAGGAPSVAAASASGLFAFCTLTQFAGEQVMAPLLRFLLVLTFLSPVAGQGVREIGKTVRGWVGTLFALFSALLPAALGFQTALSSGTDSMAVRAARFAVGQMPVVGGAVSGALGTLASSASLLQKTAGGGAFAALLSLLAPAISELLLLHLLFGLLVSVSSAFGHVPLSALFDGFRGIVDLFLGGVAAVSVAMVLSLAVVTRCAIA